jgi:predicted dehydrogenase
MSHTTRRDFLRGTAAAGLALSAGPLVLCDEPMPSERIRIGCIGLGNQGRPNLGAHLKNVVAICDVDRTRLDEARGRVQQATGKSPLAVTDYRKLLESKDVDAVVITTPDHWHALMTVHACQAGKDVYCEKPLTLTVAEGRVMVDAARKYRRVVQTGSQQRSDKRFRTACELVRNGLIGKVHTVRVNIPRVNFKGPSVPDSDPPAELDYDLWLGPAPKRPYNSKRVHYNFRFFWDYSGGQMTNFGAHDLDITQWGLGMDDSGPVAALGKARYHKDNWFEVPEWFEATYTYPSGVTVHVVQNGSGGVTFEGDKGTLSVDRKKLVTKPAELEKEALPDGAVRLYASTNHHANWLECIKSRKSPICDVEIGHRSATVCHLGNIAIRTGRKLTWDPSKEQFVGDAEANKMLRRPYRDPWKLPAV